MIRPVEMQMLLPRTESVGNAQQYENQRVVNENTFAAKEVAKEVKHNSETVKLTDFKYDAIDEGKGTYQNPRKRKKRQEKRDGEVDENELTKELIEENKQPRVNIQI